MIDLFWPHVPKGAREAVDEVLRSRFIGQGPKVDEFEREFSRFFSQEYCVSTNSGTSALETAYDLIGLKAGDHVISTPLTCTATNLPLVRRGVKIIWADILPDTLCINPIDVHAKLTPKVKAVVQVHLGGIRADVGSLHVPVVSDAAQALGIFNGTYTCCSFQAIKHITTGDGGMLTCPNEIQYHDAKLLRWFGIDRAKKIKNQWQAYKERKMTFDIELPGAKRQMNDIAAAMGLAGLKDYDDNIALRHIQFKLYESKLSNLDGLAIIDGQENKHWLFTVLVERRDDFARMLFENDIDNNVIQVRNDIYKVFGGRRAHLPVMNELEDKYISLPIGPHVSIENIEYVCDVIQKGW